MRHVQFKNVGKIYRSERGPIVALDNINLDIDAGSFVSIVGASGCGKSTLLKCVAGLERITSGEITVGGIPVSEPPRDMGFVFQRDLLFDWRTIVDNVLVSAEFEGKARRDFTDRAHKLLAIFGLSDYAARYPWELSGGMRQRVAICRSLLCSPKFLLMDEPFGALDALTRDELNDELQARWIGEAMTVLFITHSISEAVFLSDRVAVMDRSPGRIAAVFEIDLPRPRSQSSRETVAFTKYAAAIRQTMNEFGAVSR